MRVKMDGEVKELSKFKKKYSIKEPYNFKLQFQRTRIASHMYDYATTAPCYPL